MGYDINIAKLVIESKKSDLLKMNKKQLNLLLIKVMIKLK